MAVDPGRRHRNSHTHGSTLSVAVPARTQPGSIMRLKGQGLTGRNGQKGDILIRMQARIPEISDQLLEAIRQHQ